MRRLTHLVAPEPARRLRAIRCGTASDSGAVALLVAILMGGGVLIGMAALTVDVGQLYAERRQVQNGADAAALALAQDCGDGGGCDVSLTGAARTFADENANDRATRILAICGNGVAGLAGCPAQTGPELTRCPEVPATTAAWIRVRTATAQPDGTTLLPTAFARALAGNGAYDGAEVAACAQTAFGTPGSLGALPVTLSECEWNAATANGTAFVNPPPYPPYPPAAKETKLILHGTADRGGCPGGSGGSYGDLPGGFGWLDADSSCRVITTLGDVANADTGVSGSTCGDVVAANVGKLLYLPVYAEAWGSGSGGRYRISGYAAFYLTGYNLPGVHPNRVDSPVGGRMCSGSNKCIYGFFTRGIVPAAETLGTGPDLGARGIALIG